MFDIYENSIELKTIIFIPSSPLPITRLRELRQLLHNFQIDWGAILVNLYPFEAKKVVNEFPEFTISILGNVNDGSATIFCSISKISN